MFNLEKLVRKNILSLEPYSSARDEFTGAEGVFLDANENPYGSLNRYPDPYQRKLKQQLSGMKKVNAEQIFVGNGSDEVIDLAFRIFCNPSKDKALTFTPTYGMYDVSASVNDVELIKIPLTNDFQIDTNSVEKYFSDTCIKLIFICSPNNPTGNLIDNSAIEFVLNNFNGIVIIDEAYIDFCKCKSNVNLLKKYSNLIVSQTFSKAYGLAAARVGIAYASKEIIQLYNKVKPPYNVSGLNQEVALNALVNQSVFKENLQQILAQKEWLIELLSALDLVIKIYPSDTNFLLVEVKDADSVYNELVRQKVIVRNRNNVVDNCIRITVGNKEENERLLEVLKPPLSPPEGEKC